jgi:serine/threonine kinase PknH
MTSGNQPWWRSRATHCTAIVLLAIAVIGTTAITAAGRGKAPPPPPPEPVAQGISSSLVRQEDLNSIFGVDGFEYVGFFGSFSEDTNSTVTPPECSTVRESASEAPFSDIDWQVLRIIDWKTPDPKTYRFVRAMIVALPTSDDAKRSLRATAADWRKCNEKVYSVDTQGEVRRWYMKDLIETPESMTAVVAQEGSRYVCQHVRNADGKFVIGVNACGYDIADQGHMIASRIVENLRSRREPQ